MTSRWHHGTPRTHPLDPACAFTACLPLVLWCQLTRAQPRKGFSASSTATSEARSKRAGWADLKGLGPWSPWKVVLLYLKSNGERPERAQNASCAPGSMLGTFVVISCTIVTTSWQSQHDHLSQMCKLRVRQQVRCWG